MQRLKMFVFAGLLLLVQSVHADMFDIQLSNKSGRIAYASEIYGGQDAPLDLDLGLFFNTDSDKVFHVGMMVRNDTLDNPLVFSIGARLYYGDIGNAPGQIHAKFSGIAIGGDLLFIPNNLGGLGFGIHYFGAPNVVSYMDADSFSEYGARINYEITRQADVSLGYRKYKVNLTNHTTVSVESKLYIGINLRF